MSQTTTGTETATAAATARPHEGVPLPERRRAMGTLLLAIFMAVLDGSITNVALPTIARELHASPAASVWVVNAFQISVCCSLFAFASLGELLGFDRVWKFGMAIFTVGSLFCAISHSLGTLIVSRVIQGLGAAIIMGIQPSIMRSLYPARMLGRGTGWFALTVATTSALGPTFGGAILAVAPWPWLFLINVPIGIVIQFLAPRTLPKFEVTGHIRDFDVPGAIFAALTLGGFTMTVQAFAHGDDRWLVAVFFVLVACALGAFIWRERHAPRPVLDLKLFSRPMFSISALTSICSFTGQGIGVISLPYYFQTVLGRTPMEAGLLLTPWPIAVACVAPFAGRLGDRYPVWILATCGLTVMAIGGATLALLPQHPSTIDILWREILLGLGFGFFQAPNNRELIGSVPRNRAGAAGGMLSTARLFGQSFGAALVAVIFATLGARAIESAGANMEAIARATPVAMWTVCGVALIGACISSLRRGHVRTHD